MHGVRKVDILKGINASVNYIESHLDDEIDMEDVSRLAGSSAEGFRRLFSFLTGVTISDYIRRRRLTLAVTDLQSGAKVIDVAVKYGFSSADAFSRAFHKQHGIKPSDAHIWGNRLNIYPPISFHILIKGADKMNFRIIETEEKELFGISKQFAGESYKTREELRHTMWSEEYDNVPGMLCDGQWNEPRNVSYDGEWYGIWQNGKYAICRLKKDVKNSSLEKLIIPTGTYAAFTTEPGGLAWKEFPKLFELIFESWLPSSEYTQVADLIIEVLHLWTDKEIRNKKRYYEVWIPVKKK